ncbi:MAG: hypothetical protein C3F02_01070 [Parcubacteria group bacterium]|nr:MAG: hypothetical protein C3F02_01070 [Parcubacteria group bacterium]
MGALLSKKAASMAISIISPSVIQLLRQSIILGGIFKRGQLHVVVLDPTSRWEQGAEIIDAVLAEYTFNEDNRPLEGPYRDIALGKAMVSWRTGQPSGWVAQFAPHLLLPGDSKHRGSWVTDGIVTTASGVQGYFDEMVAKWLGAACSALSRHQMEAIILDKERDTV